MDVGLLLQMEEDGTWGIKEEPFATIECATEDDFNFIKNAMQKQREEPPIYEGPTNEAKDDVEIYCPVCDYYFENDSLYCPDCGQKILWP